MVDNVVVAVPSGTVIRQSPTCVVQSQQLSCVSQIIGFDCRFELDVGTWNDAPSMSTPTGR